MTYGGHPPISGSVSGSRMIPDRSFVSWPRAFRRAGITRPCGGLGYNKIPQGMASERWLRRNGFRSHNGGSRQDGGSAFHPRLARTGGDGGGDGRRRHGRRGDPKGQPVPSGPLPLSVEQGQKETPTTTTITAVRVEVKPLGQCGKTRETT